MKLATNSNRTVIALYSLVNHFLSSEWLLSIGAYAYNLQSISATSCNHINHVAIMYMHIASTL